MLLPALPSIASEFAVPMTLTKLATLIVPIPETVSVSCARSTLNEVVVVPETRPSIRLLKPVAPTMRSMLGVKIVGLPSSWSTPALPLSTIPCAFSVID
jgi:hypothetical protein